MQYGVGLIINVPYPVSDVTQVVEDVAQDGVIRGTKEYNKDEFVSGATPADATRVFPAWKEAGRVFYKVRLKAIDPRNFKDGNDVGTLAVRYVVQPQGDKNSVLRIDAIFVEDFRRVAHSSNGSVESAEYKDIHDRLETMESMKAQAAETNQERQQQQSSSRSAADSVPVESSPSENAQMAPPAGQPGATAAVTPTSAVPESAPSTPPPTAAPATAAVATPTTVVLDSSTSAPPPPAVETLEDHVKDLRRQAERLVKSPGAPLKSAPFHSASTLQTLPTRTEVLVEISTPYWLGVETHDGQHGWIERDELELLP